MKSALAKDLTVYKKAYALAMRVFDVTKRFPPEERYALTGQLRRSSRSPCRSLGEAWAKRRYEAHFIGKLTDADGENSETDTSLDMARDCAYITDAEHAEMTAECAVSSTAVSLPSIARSATEGRRYRQPKWLKQRGEGRKGADPAHRQESDTRTYCQL